MISLIVNNCVRAYINTLPGVVLFTGMIGFVSGVFEMVTKETVEITDIIDLLGRTTLGLCIGLTYPISFPLCLHYATKF
jgi:hypothetical protein